ncbi:PepSY domain-containing protein [Sporosarcina sp. CAU 1771]
MNLTSKKWIIPTLLTCVIIIAVALYIGSIVSKKELLSEQDVRQQIETKYKGAVEGITLEKDFYLAELNRDGALYSVAVDAQTGKVYSLTLTQANPVEEQVQVIPEQEIREWVATTYAGEVERISLQEANGDPVYDLAYSKDQNLVKMTVNALTGEVISEEVKSSVNKPVEEPAKENVEKPVTQPEKTPVKKPATEKVLITREKAIEIALSQLKGEVEYVEFESTSDGGYYLVEIEQDNEDSDDLEAVFQIHAVSGKIMSVTWDD